MRSALFKTASFLSMILLAIAVALWARGYFASDSLYMKYHRHPYIHTVKTRHGLVARYRVARTTITNGRGCIGVTTEEYLESGRPIPRISFERGLSVASDLRLLRPRFSWLGLEHATDSSFGTESIRVPTWMLVVVFSLLPLWRESRRYAKRRRSRANLCIECGYNLTGNTSGTCPECGTKVPVTSIASRQ